VNMFTHHKVNHNCDGNGNGTALKIHPALCIIGYSRCTRRRLVLEHDWERDEERDLEHDSAYRSIRCRAAGVPSIVNDPPRISRRVDTGASGAQDDCRTTDCRSEHPEKARVISDEPRSGKTRTTRPDCRYRHR
jgi:hypothetical protein